MNLEESSDPLPYTQLDRAVKAPAARLAQKLQVTYQHALGGLAEFWELCGDPRDLSRLLDQGIREVVLDQDEVMGRFSMAMGVDCSAVTVFDLCRLRILELQVDGRYRVRGMSRYFKVVELRRVRREAASIGGKKSAETRAGRYGSAQPASGVASGDASRFASGKPHQPTLGLEANAEATPKQTPNTADSGQRSSKDRSINATEVWADLTETFEHFGLTEPEIHPKERNSRIHSLIKQLPKPDPKLLDQVLFVALETKPALSTADNPLSYLQSMLKDPTTKQELLTAVAERAA